jgi:alpha-ribazole phosphatase
MLTLTLVRHPPVQASQQCYGRLDLLPTAHDLAQAAQQLHHLYGQTIISSPAQRCLRLAQHLSPCVTINPLWQELDFGQWEGLAWDDIPRHALDDWAADIWHYRVGQTGETAAELLIRVQRAIAQLCEQGHSQATVITHAGVIRMVFAHYGKIADHDRWTAPIAYATPYTLEC